MFDDRGDKYFTPDEFKTLYQENKSIHDLNIKVVMDSIYSELNFYCLAEYFTEVKEWYTCVFSEKDRYNAWRLENDTLIIFKDRYTQLNIPLSDVNRIYLLGY